MKNSVIFWNIVVIIIYLCLLIFGGKHVQIFTVFFTSILSFIVLLMTSEYGISPFNFKELYDTKFPFWCVYISGSYIMIYIVIIIWKAIAWFNRTINGE